MGKISFLPSILPDEHIFSAFARLAYLKPESSQLFANCDASFNRRTLSVGPIYNAYLARLLTLYSSQMSEEELLKKHTPLGFYYHGMRYRDRFEIVKHQNDKLDLYFAGSQILRHARTWRWCCACAKEDTLKHGTSYWHLSHQLPTASICEKHRTELHHQCNKCNFSVQNIKDQPMPPLAECPNCSEAFSRTRGEPNKHVQWIQDSGMELLLDESPFLKPAYEFLATHALDLLIAKLQKGGGEPDIFFYDRQQRHFIHWLRKEGLAKLFVDDIDFSSCKLLDLATIQSAPRRAPLISHLLWARYIGVYSLKEAKRGLVRKSA